jgi:hypothetical protein
MHYASFSGLFPAWRFATKPSSISQEDKDFLAELRRDGDSFRREHSAEIEELTKIFSSSAALRREITDEAKAVADAFDARFSS